MKIVRNAPRNLRSHLHRIASKLFILTPALAGDTSYRYAVIHDGALILIGKGVKSEAVAKAEAVNRFGLPATKFQKQHHAKLLKVAA